LASSTEGSLFLHYPCFDGLVSAAIAWDFLESSQGWRLAAICPVNYDRRDTWLTTPLPSQSVVVDFLYHPDAAFWADHHPTTFINEESRLNFELRTDKRFFLYDPKATSCAKLLWERVGYASSDPTRYAEMAVWADRTDSATYDSVDEAIFGTQPALRIARSLSAGQDQEYCAFLLQAMHALTLEEIAELPEVASRESDVRVRTQKGIDLVNERIAMQSGGIVVVDVDEAPDAIVNRYSPYFGRFRDARYSVALIRSAKGASILAMRNPWINFESVHLGEIFEPFKGGGHQRVAAVVIPADSGTDPRAAVDGIVAAIRAKDRALAEGERRAIA